MAPDNDCLIGEVTVEQVEKWDETQWRVFQFKQMVNTNKRLSKLENQAAWRNILIAVPWAVLGGIIAYLAK